MSPLRFLLLSLALCPTAWCAEPSPHRDSAMWVYETDILLSSPAERSQLLEFCQQRQISDLFWATHFQRDPAAPKETPVYSIPESQPLRSFLAESTRAGIRLHALSGDPSDVSPGNLRRATARVEALLHFNATGRPDEHFAGIHLDIEPHAVPAWKASSPEDRTAALTRLVEAHAAAAALLHAKAPGMIYGADVVFWLNKRNPDGTSTYPVTFNGLTADPAAHLLKVVDHLAVMGYRGFAEGKNGLISLVEPMIAQADHTSARIYVGVKMADIGPPLETFNGKPEAELNRATASVEAHFKAHRGYAGIAYFMYGAYRQYAQPVTAK